MHMIHAASRKKVGEIQGIARALFSLNAGPVFVLVLLDQITRPFAASFRVALDNYEASRALSEIAPGASPAVLALGPERGWSAGERDFLRANRFDFAHLGSRVLRMETACVAAVTLMKAKLGSM